MYISNWHWLFFWNIDMTYFFSTFMCRIFPCGCDVWTSLFSVAVWSPSARTRTRTHARMHRDRVRDPALLPASPLLLSFVTAPHMETYGALWISTPGRLNLVDISQPAGCELRARIPADLTGKHLWGKREVVLLYVLGWDWVKFQKHIVCIIVLFRPTVQTLRCVTRAKSVGFV